MVQAFHRALGGYKERNRRLTVHLEVTVGQSDVLPTFSPGGYRGSIRRLIVHLMVTEPNVYTERSRRLNYT